MKNDDLYGRNGSNSNTPNNRINKKSSISSNQTESFKMIDLDVKKTKKDIDDIFSYTKTKLRSNSKEFNSSVDDIFKNASMQSDGFFKDVENKIDQIFNLAESRMDRIERRSSDLGHSIADEVSSGYEIAFESAETAHKRSVDNRLKEEQRLAQKVSKMYEESFSSKNSSISQMIDQAGKAADEAKQRKSSDSDDLSIYSSKEVLTDPDKRGINTKAFTSALKTGIISAIIDGGKQFVNIWMNRFETSMDRIVSTYENTFHNVSVLTDTSQKSYMQMQDGIVDYLNENNLDNAIRTSEVMQEMSDAVMRGITDAGEAQNVALQNSITKAINPFIDVTSEAYQDMQLALGDKFVNSSNAIVKAVNDGTAGTTRFISKNIDDMLAQFEPVILNAKSDQFDKQFAEMAADLEAAVASGAMTSQQAEEYKQSVYSMTNDPYNTITNSNDISLVRSMLDSLQNGNFENQNIEGMLQTLAENDQRLYEGTQDAFSRSIVQSNIGSNRTSIWQDSDALNEVTKIINDKNSGDYEDALTSLTKGLEDTYTNLWQKDTGAENKMVGIAQFEQQYPDAFKLLKGMATTLSSILTAIVGNYVTNKFVDQMLPRITGKGGTPRTTGTGGTGNSGGFVDNLIKKFTESKIFKKGADLFRKAFSSGADDVAKAAGSSADDIAKAVGSGADNIAKAGASVGDDIAKGVVGSADDVAKAAGVAGKAGSLASKAAGPLAALGFIIDGFLGSTKSDEWFGNDSLDSKIKSSLGATIAGSGPGIGQGSIGEVALNAGSNALKWGSAGAMVGSAAGPIGTIVGGAVGGISGLITGLIGGERMSDILSGTVDFVKSIPQVQMLTNEFGIIKENIFSLGKELKSVWSDEEMTFMEKLGASYGTLKASVVDTFQDTWNNIKDVSFDTLGKIGDKFVDFKDKIFDVLEGAKKEFEEFIDNPIEWIKDKGKSAIDSVKDFGEKTIDKVVSVKDDVVGAFSGMSEASDKAYEEARAKDKEGDSKGSHASGLNYVPYDGYLAELHKGETVFNRRASNIIRDALGLSGTSTQENTSHSEMSILDSFINKFTGKSAITEENKTNVGSEIARVSEKLIGSNIQKQSLDTSSLENAIYTIGDKIVSAINSQSRKNNNIIDRNSGTVNVRFNQSSDDDDLTAIELPV